MTIETTPIIRPITLADEPEWRSLWRAFLEFYDTELPSKTYDESFRRIVAGTDGMHGFIAMSGNTAIGLAHFLFHRTFWAHGPTCYLQDLFTIPAARGQGVARRMIEAVYTAASSGGSSEVYWLTADTNYSGRMLYDRVAAKTPFIVYEKVL